jgi:triacylglycerol lipase
MTVPRRRLTSAGYRSVAISYPSRKLSIEELAVHVNSMIPEADQGSVHFLTHSLGGIVARQLLREHRPRRLGRVVMLAPPNRGSQLAERFLTFPMFQTASGPAGRQLGTGQSSKPLSLGPVDFELGVIAGNRPTLPTHHLIPEESDGTVAVSETRVEGMKDFLVVQRGHTFIMNDPAVIDQAIHFFRHGHFER